ncbi:Sec-independent protein translocase protein TatB [Sphingomonas sp. S2M10]|jgi:sec-independent protein translocase protein TatB|uniref:Sec-independent protein translocase protein TatB n=1 Tax=Sphingomonas sp. S2M10 TaxID=2705010 RepID=UPI0014571219|nr:Sec-independent protein translocase protein TatB [Sphingomonas sp. S2M10]NLS28990.1 Sec-independent protein translocase protein TatB [Sphingomonas sp. S2M10]
MFDIAPSEFLLVAIVALVFIGPKDLPRAMHFVGKWMGKARGVARQFRSGLDSMVREAELAELEKQWAAENERIMRQYPPQPLAAPDAHAAPAAIEHQPQQGADQEDHAPVMTPKPDIHPDPVPETVSAPQPAQSEARPVPPAGEVRP